MRALDTSPPPISVIAFEVSISESTTEAMDIGFSESFVSVLTFFDSFIAPRKILSISSVINENRIEFEKDFFTCPNISGSPTIIESIPVITSRR